jgi:hypothetical protein
MASSEYYRRQSELCLQLALLRAELNADLQMTFWLLALAKELRDKAAQTEGESDSCVSCTTDLTRSPSQNQKLH